MEKRKIRERRFFRFRIESISLKIIFLDIGAFSFKQAHLLTLLGLRTLGECAQKINYWKISRPKESPNKGAFIMYEGEILRPYLKEDRKQN